MTQNELKKALTRLGFRVNTNDRLADGIRNFQRGWNLGKRLSVDGIVGPLTAKAIAKSLSRLNAGESTMSSNFSFSEFACSCDGKYADCERIRVHRGLVRGLEKYRVALGGPVAIVSGYRCPRRNREVGGATRSQHLEGTAADISKRLSLSRVIKLERFGGIGYSRSSGKVRHVDIRRGSRKNPVTWQYA